MNSGIFYLYEYEKDKQMRNTGFIKITTCFNTCCLQIHAQNLNPASDNSVQLYTFFQKDAFLYTKHLSDLPVLGSSICTTLNIDDSNFPKGKRLFDLSGFFLFDGQNYYAILDENCSFDTEALKPWEDSTPPSVPNPVLEQPSSVCSHKESLPKRKIQKIQRKDLSTLPRQYWCLANNSFLMHGCHNYKHLLLIEENGHLQLGIPGIYSPTEARAASLFGFPIFLQFFLKEIELSDDEKDDDDSFGYWCRFL